MAYELIWSPAARDDLHDIVVFIARDNPNRAMPFGYELISETDRLQEFPESGRTVPSQSRESTLSDRAHLALSARNSSSYINDPHSW